MATLFSFPSRSATCCRSPAEALPPGKSPLAARDLRFTRSCVRAMSQVCWRPAPLVMRLGRLDTELAGVAHPVCGAASVFVGQFHGGEIYNQYPQTAGLEGTRRWLPGTDPASVERDFRLMLADLATDTGTRIDCECMLIRDSFALDPANPLVTAFQRCYQATSGGTSLPTGPKPFVDDGNSFYGNARVPSITHGPRTGGQHTISEWVEIDDLMRLAWLYAAVAVEYCQPSSQYPSPPSKPNSSKDHIA